MGTIIFLVIMFFLLPSFVIFYAEKSSIKWIAIVGSLIFTIAKLGQYYASGKEKIFDRFSFFSKLGMFVALGSIILRALMIIKQQDVYFMGVHHVGSSAVSQGLFLITFAIALAIFGIKYVD